MTNQAKAILDQLKANPSVDAEQLLAMDLGNSSIEIDFIIEQLKAKRYL